MSKRQMNDERYARTNQTLTLQPGERSRGSTSFTFGRLRDAFANVDPKVKEARDLGARTEERVKQRLKAERELPQLETERRRLITEMMKLRADSSNVRAELGIKVERLTARIAHHREVLGGSR